LPGTALALIDLYERCDFGDLQTRHHALALQDDPERLDAVGARSAGDLKLPRFEVHRGIESPKK
jgi:hypothetical protein